MSEKLFKAIANRKLESVKQVVEAGASCNAERNGSSALYSAVVNCVPEIVLYLLEEGADPNKKNSNSESIPLHAALSFAKLMQRDERCYLAYIEIAKCLISNSSPESLFISNKYGETPLGLIQKEQKIREALSVQKTLVNSKISVIGQSSSNQKSSVLSKQWEKRQGKLKEREENYRDSEETSLLMQPNIE